MPPAIVTVTFQSALITLCSCLIALYLTPDEPPHIPSLLLYCLLSTPPNFLYQKYIESKFPGYTLQKIEVDDGGKGVEVEKKLNAWNTCIKMGLDQTLAAVINVMAYIGGTRLLKGVPPGLCWEAVKEQTKPIMIAGYKLWPAVGLAQHLVVPVEKRIVVGSLVGLGWGTFLTLKAAR